jgi:hypothetical protein
MEARLQLPLEGLLEARLVVLWLSIELAGIGSGDGNL